MSRNSVLRLALGAVVLGCLCVLWLRHRATPAAARATSKSEFVAEEPLSDSELTPVETAAAQVAPPPSAPTTSPVTEASLMDQLRRMRSAGEHRRAIELAREGNRRYPDSSLAPERHSILIHALADNEQRSEARGEAEYMVNHYPDSDWVRAIERYTGAHRHRNARLNDAGELEFH